jgi:hypothetical protein
MFHAPHLLVKDCNIRILLEISDSVEEQKSAFSSVLSDVNTNLIYLLKKSCYQLHIKFDPISFSQAWDNIIEDHQ